MALILVVDDEAGIRKMLRKLFEREGFQVVDAPDGVVGLKIARESRPDLAIIDLVMPEKEGIETIREMKKMLPDTKIIAMSGGGRSTPDHYLNMARMLGAIHTFAKPIMTDELLDVVRKITGEGEVPHPA